MNDEADNETQGDALNGQNPLFVIAVFLFIAGVGFFVGMDALHEYRLQIDAFERFVVTEPRQEILTPGEYAENGTEITPPVLRNWVSHLVLPLAYDTSNLNTLLTNES